MFEQLKHSAYEANMELWRKKLVLYTWGNVSQADRAHGIFAIKPSGVPYETLKASDMVIVSLETGKRVEGDLNPSSDTPTHYELYKAFENINGITHTHSTYATAWAQSGKELLCLGTTHADYIRGSVPLTRYLTDEETEAAYEANTASVIIEAFNGKNPLHTPAVLVRGHGPFTFGKDAASSVYNAVVLEEVAKMAYLSFSINPQANKLPQYIQDKHFLRKHGPNAYYGQLKR
ncbi:MAG: L-ribulose-5-phosphate 4-epimerase [Clostridia bacterium]|nr:L-ribulose-5-phosphate 4-epimerase [Clostridia bacterium]